MSVTVVYEVTEERVTHHIGKRPTVETERVQRTTLCDDHEAARALVDALRSLHPDMTLVSVT